VMNNLDFALQQMSRDIRVGKNYYCGEDYSLPGLRQSCSADPYATAFSYTSHDGSARVVYKLVGNQIMRSETGVDGFYSITSPQIVIDKLRFYVSGAEANSTPQLQPKILVVLDGHVKIKNSQTNFQVQTTISSRLLNRGQ